MYELLTKISIWGGGAHGYQSFCRYLGPLQDNQTSIDHTLTRCWINVGPTSFEYLWVYDQCKYLLFLTRGSTLVVYRRLQILTTKVDSRAELRLSGGTKFSTDCIYVQQCYQRTHLLHNPSNANESSTRPFHAKLNVVTDYFSSKQLQRLALHSGANKHRSLP